MSGKPEPVDQKIAAMLEVMWKKSRPAIDERVAALRTAQQRLIGHNLDRTEQKEAESAAHKLAGILGTFGLPDCSALASKIERLLAQPSSINEVQRQELEEWLKELESRIEAKNG